MDAIHSDQLPEHGGLPSVRDEYALESGLARPRRVRFLAMVTFLGINGVEFEASDADAVVAMLAPADGTASEGEWATWIRAHTRRGR